MSLGLYSLLLRSTVEMEGLRRYYCCVASVTLLLLLFRAGSAADNIDIDRPIARLSPSVRMNTSEDFFGYAVALHQVEKPPNRDFNAAIEATRIIVGAPKGTFPGGLDLPGLASVNETGLVYQCPLTPGSCTGVFGNGTGADKRLFDDEPNSADEEKRGQFMGATLASNGDHFMVCSPRWIFVDPQFGIAGRSYGRCFTSGRNLTGFETLQPCRFGNIRSFSSDAYCMAGTGATLYDDVHSLAVLGGPGFIRGRGQIYTFNLSASNLLDSLRGNERASRTYFGDVPDLPDYVYNGFTLTTGHISDTTTADVISAAPRFNGVSYIGMASAIQPAAIEATPSIFVQGQQNGEYFGWSMAAADLNGDGYDELLVGAPMYSNVSHPEQGRVYVFNNTGGNLSSDPIVVSGSGVTNGRFGFSIVNLGDANNDGYEDVAIGAPFVDDLPDANGTVYIYLGSPTDVINTTPYQVITASDVMTRIGLNRLKTFGYSLASGVDVDANEYNDLLVGAFDSQVTVLFRTRSIADIEVRVNTSTTMVDVNEQTCGPVGSQSYACFDVEVCATYNGRGLEGELESFLVLTERVNMTVNSETRLFFNTQGRPNVYNESFTFATNNTEECRTITTYIRDPDELRDELTSFTLDIAFQEPFRENLNVDGNQTLIDFRTIPIFRTSGNFTVSVESVVRCDELGNPTVCTSNLNLTFHNITFRDAESSIVRGFAPNQLVAGTVETVEVYLNYNNLAEPAFGPRINFSLPSTPNFGNLRARIDNRVVTCNVNSEQISCELIPSPSRKEDRVRQIVISWRLNTVLRGDEANITIPFQIGIGNTPDTEDILGGNKRVNVIIDVVAIANLRIPNIVFTDMPTMYTGQDPRMRTTNLTQGDLGSRVVLQVTVSSGRLTVPSVELDIFIPSNDSGSGGFFYIYPSRIDEDPLNMRCNSTNLNPENLPAPAVTRRRRRSATLTAATNDKRYKRQVSNVKDCSNPVTRNVSCAHIQCRFPNFGSTTTVQIIGYLDERFYSTQMGDFSFIAYASVRAVEPYIMDPTPQDNMRSTSPYILMRERVTQSDFPVWIPIVAAIGALLLLAIIVIILYFVGFFHRKSFKKDETEPDGDIEPPAGGVESIPPTVTATVLETAENEKPEKPDLENSKARETGVDETEYGAEGVDTEGENGKVDLADKEPDETSL